MKKILIVEDQMLARKYLCSCIEKSTECEVASALTRADAALQRCGEGHIDLVVMDICTENDSDGLDAAEAIKKYYPRIKIVMVTSMLEGRFLDRARKIGADSFWYKDSPSGDLISVIEGTLAGKNFWPDKVPAVQLGKALSCDLSDQEMETLRLLCEGKTNAEIAAEASCGRIIGSYLYQPDVRENRIHKPQSPDGCGGKQTLGRTEQSARRIRRK